MDYDEFREDKTAPPTGASRRSICERVPARMRSIPLPLATETGLPSLMPRRDTQSSDVVPGAVCMWRSVRAGAVPIVRRAIGWDASESTRPAQGTPEAANPPPPIEPHMRRCSRCGVEHLYPTPGWSDWRCPPCTRALSSRPQKEPIRPRLAPAVRVDQAGKTKNVPDANKGSCIIGAWAGREISAGGVTRNSIKPPGRTARKRSQQWRENADADRVPDVSAKPRSLAWVGIGRMCPACVSARAKAAYEAGQVRPGPAGSSSGDEGQAEVKRALKRNQKSRESAPGPDSAAPSPEGGGQGG